MIIWNASYCLHELVHMGVCREGVLIVSSWHVGTCDKEMRSDNAGKQAELAAESPPSGRSQRQTSGSKFCVQSGTDVGKTMLCSTSCWCFAAIEPELMLSVASHASLLDQTTKKHKEVRCCRPLDNLWFTLKTIMFVIQWNFRISTHTVV